MTQIDLSEAAGLAARELFAHETAGHFPQEQDLAIARRMWDESVPGDFASRVKTSYLQRGLAITVAIHKPIARQASDIGYEIGKRDGYAESIDRPLEYVNPWEDR